MIYEDSGKSTWIFSQVMGVSSMISTASKDRLQGNVGSKGSFHHHRIGEAHQAQSRR